MTRSTQPTKERDKFVAALEKLAKKADGLGLKLGNGAEVGSILGTIAEELRV